MSEHSVTGDWRASAEPATAELPHIPGYEVLAELGRGGMGVVYKARQVTLKRLVALKVIRDGALAGPQDRVRFRVEAEAAARMQHPNIVQIYEAGEHQGRPYFAMELVEGDSLDKHLQGQPQQAKDAAALVRTLARAIQHAHWQHVVHRDLKPANVLLGGVDRGSWIMEREGGRTTNHDSQFAMPKIADFGLAKCLDADSTARTQDGVILGTASYMAPEQAAGRIEAIGLAVDVYALGAILYELLTGRPPFLADSWLRTVDQVLRDEPTAPTRLQADVPPELETICLKCLEKEPARRYVSADALADDLGRFLHGKPVVAVPLTAKQRLARLAARDGFDIGEEIGNGPRSTVYRALAGPVRQPVALKVFAEGTFAAAAWEVRVQRGAEMWAGLAHPHLVPVQRAGWWDGIAYVAMEYVPQGSLAARLVGPFPVGQALHLVEQLAELVGYLHRQGVVHGNLKPSNVLLAADGIPRLGDLHATGGPVARPVAGDACASLGYLAPELLDEARENLQPTADFYGLGLILYEMLAGHPPFAAATAAELLEQVRSSEPPPPSRFNSQVMVQVDALVLRCLRKNPWKRYAHGYDLLRQLRLLREELSSAGVSSARSTRRRPAPW